MRCLEIKREMTDVDIALVTELLDAAARADGRRPLSDHLYLDLVGGGDEGFVGLLAYEPGHEHPVAYAQISQGNGSHVLELVIHPHHRYEMATIGPELMAAALDTVRDSGGGTVNWWVFEPTTAHDSLADEVGMTKSRTLLQMRLALPIGQHATITTRPFVPGLDDAAWLDVNNRAFASHEEQGGWSLDTFRRRQAEEWFDPDGFRMFEQNGQLAGFCWTKIHRDGEAHDLGEIYVIAVHPDFGGRGLGTELTLAGLDHLSAAGITAALLYVDADNTTAVAMYRRLGFVVAATNAAFATCFDIDRSEGSAPISTP